jgi:hypothetical protein
MEHYDPYRYEEMVAGGWEPDQESLDQHQADAALLSVGLRLNELDTLDEDDLRHHLLVAAQKAYDLRNDYIDALLSDPSPASVAVATPPPAPKPTTFTIRSQTLSPPEQAMFKALRAAHWRFIAEPPWFFGTDQLRPDFMIWWSGTKGSGFVVVEIDSDEWHSGPSAHEHDEVRERTWENMGLQFLRFSGRQALRDTLDCLKVIRERCVAIWGPEPR